MSNKGTNAELTSPEELPQTTTPRRVAARRLLRAETFYVLGLAAFAALASFAYFNAYFGWDLRVSHTLQSFNAPGLSKFMALVSIPGNGLTPYVTTAITASLFLIIRRRSEAAGILLSAGGSALLNNLIKILIARPRPDSNLIIVMGGHRSLSFPSGHVTFYVCYFGFLFFVAYALLPRGSLTRRIALLLMAIPIFLIGFSRVYLGAHWPSDTLGAYLVSGLWLAFSLDMYRRWKQRAAFHASEGL